MTNCPICPSNPLNLSGVCTTSPADASAPVGVLTGVYVFGESVSSGWGWTIDARIKNRVRPDSASPHVLVYQLSIYLRDQGTHALSSSSSTTGGGSTGRRSTKASAWRPSFSPTSTSTKSDSLVSFSSLNEHNLALSGCWITLKEYILTSALLG